MPHIVDARAASLAFGIVSSDPHRLRRIRTETMLAQSLLLLLLRVWGARLPRLHDRLLRTKGDRTIAPTLMIRWRSAR